MAGVVHLGCPEGVSVRVALPRVAEQVVRRQALFLDGLGDGPAEFACLICMSSSEHRASTFSAFTVSSGDIVAGLMLAWNCRLGFSSLKTWRRWSWSGRAGRTPRPPGFSRRRGDVDWRVVVGSWVVPLMLW